MSTSRSPFRRVIAIVGVTGLAVLGAVALPQAANAVPTTYHVTNFADAGAGSFRAAVLAANGNSGLDTIVFDTVGTVTLLVSGITITDGVIIQGAGSTINRTFDGDVVTVDIAGGTPTADRAFEINSLTMNGAGGLGRAIRVLYNSPLDSLSLTNASFIGFEGADLGGAICVDGMTGAFTADTTTFTDNLAIGTMSGDNGGAISLDEVGGPIRISNSLFDGNEGHRGGAVAILNSPTSAITVTNTQFTSNTTAANDGGGLYVAIAASLTVDDVELADNSAGENGGAVYLYDVPTVTITASEFARNSTTGNGSGGAVFFRQGVTTASIDNSSFTGNSSTGAGSGGAISAGLVSAIGSLRISGTTFADNTAPEGGAVFLEKFSADSWIQNSVFTGNTATSTFGTGGYGGAVSFGTQRGTVPAPFTITATTFEGNAAVRTSGGGSAGAGGAIAALTIESTLTIEDSTFVDNTLGPFPGAIGSSIWVDEITGTFDLINSTVSGSDYWEIHIESAGDGSFVYFSHSTFTTDRALSFGRFAGASVTHVIFDSRPTAFPISGVDIRVQWSLFRAPDDPAQIISSNTRFDVPNMILGPLQNNGGPTETRLPLPGSPAIDKGDPSATFLPVYDQREAGFDRVVNQIVDIGAVEASKSLAPTGSDINPVIPIAGGVLLLLGVGAVILANRRRKPKAH
ncbi:hypothetical protein BH10ACT7_BH10ACT7_10930 [soil metagenome]